MTWRPRLPTGRWFHLAAPYLMGCSAVTASTLLGLATNRPVGLAIITLMVLTIIAWCVLEMRAFRDIGLLALATLPSAALPILAASFIPTMFGACAFAGACI